MKVTIADRAKIAGHELMRGNFGNVVKSFTAPQEAFINPAQYRNDLAQGFWWFGNDGCDRYFTFNGANSSLKAYKECPPVAAILNRKAQALVNGKTWILDINGKAKDKESKKEAANKIRRLFAKPNILQNGLQFEAQLYMMMQLFGYAVVLIDKPNGFPNTEASSMWVLPNWLLSIYESEAPFYSNGERKAEPVIAKIEIAYKNNKTALPLDNIVIFKDFSPSIDCLALPQSRLEPIQMPINNIIGAYESRNTLIRRRGPQFIVSSAYKDAIGTRPLTPDEKTEVEGNFTLRYGLTKGQAQAIVTSAAVDVKTIGFDVAQLKLHEEVTESAIAVCNGLSYPPFLLGLSDSTYNNQAEASRGLYMETTIPEANSIADQWNVVFDTTVSGIVITKDFSHVAALQEDKQKMATARNINSQSLDRDFKNNVITLDMYRTAQDLDPVSDEFGAMYYWQLIAKGWTFGNTKPMSDNTQNSNDNGTTANQAGNGA